METPNQLHSFKVMRRMVFNQAFALIYSIAILTLFYRHAITIFYSTTFPSFLISISMLVSDLVLAFMWLANQSFHMRPIVRKEYPEHLKNVVKNDEDFPALDIFICTADPYKEPPIDVVNTALSVMAYDYPSEKISVYVSDDGGSKLTLFAFMEAAKFAKHWLPYCRDNNIMERSPDAYFTSNYRVTSSTEDIKMMYDLMKSRIDTVLESGNVPIEYITTEEEVGAFSKWNQDFTRLDHPTVIQVLLESGTNKDVAGQSMPNLIYFSREKNKVFTHHFKGGALNSLLRVSAVMTNAPIILTQDCDMYSNDPTTVKRALCYFLDESIQETLGWVQFPQHFHGVNKADIYACEHKRLFQLNPPGLDGLRGPNYVGTGCFFRRRAFFSGPESFIEPDLKELRPDHVVTEHVNGKSVLELAHHVAGCNYENHTNWGRKIGFRYGSLVEDYHSGYKLHCEGWKSVFCNPERAAFLGNIPISLIDVLNQSKRWAVGLLEVGLHRYSPITYGVHILGILMGLAYAYYAFWAIWAIPITIYAFIPQLSLLNGTSIFPKVSDPWFWLYAFLFVGSYVQDLLVFILGQGTKERWWSDQRMWIIRGVSSFLLGLIEFLAKNIGIKTHGFNVTSKVVDNELSKRYDRGVFEFGVASPMFVPIAMAAIVNFIALIGGLLQVLVKGGSLDGVFGQLFIAGFGVLNSIPVYEAMVVRNDSGKMPMKTTLISSFLSLCLYAAFSIAMKIV